MTFKDQLQQTLYGGSAEGPNTGGTNSAQVGLGVQLGSIDAVMSDGSMQATGTPLDVAIQGDGCFRVGIGDPSTTPATMPTEMNYTRAGNFIRNDQGYVATPEGYYVMGRDATTTPASDAFIQIPDGASGIAVGTDGDVSYVPAGGGARTAAGTISLAKFPNDEGLLRLSGNRWAAHPSAGARAGRHAGRHDLRPDDRRHAGDVQRRPGVGVHQHDRRPARLPGQLEGHLDVRRDAPGAGQPQALARLPFSAASRHGRPRERGGRSLGRA